MCLGVPGKVLSIEGEEFARTAQVEFGGVSREVSLAYVPQARVGDYVVAHVGFAISVIDEDEARRTLALLRELAEAHPDEPAGPRQ